MAYKEQNYTAEKDTMLVSLVVMAFLFLGRTIRLAYRVCAGGLSLIQGKPVERQKGIETSTHQSVSVDQVNLPVEKVQDFADTVPIPPKEAEYRVASRIHIAELMQSDVRVARIWFYTYEQAGKIRRVLKIDDRQVRKILGTDRYYMKDVDWDPKTGDLGMEKIKQAAHAEVMSLLMARLKRSGGSKVDAVGSMHIAKAPAPVVQPVAKPPVSLVLSDQAQQGTNKIAEPLKVSQVQATQSPAAEIAGKPEARPVKGDKFVGVIAEMGRVTRPGQGGTEYSAYCLKLDQDGKHTTHYGVEIERELLERNCSHGDTVALTYMGRQKIEGTMFKNLYRIDVLKRHNAAKGAH
jgi:hypothetical protein